MKMNKTALILFASVMIMVFMCVGAVFAQSQTQNPQTNKQNTQTKHTTTVQPNNNAQFGNSSQPAQYGGGGHNAAWPGGSGPSSGFYQNLDAEYGSYEKRSSSK